MHLRAHSLRSAEWCWSVCCSSARVKVSHLSCHSFITTCKGKHTSFAPSASPDRGRREMETYCKLKVESLSLYIHMSCSFSHVPSSLYLSSVFKSISLSVLFFQQESLFLSFLALTKCQNVKAVWCKYFNLFKHVVQQKIWLKDRFSQKYLDFLAKMFLFEAFFSG